MIIDNSDILEMFNKIVAESNKRRFWERARFIEETA